MKKIFIFLITIAVIGLLACERILDVDLSDEKPLIVMYGTVEPDMPINVSISKSFLFTDIDSTAPYLKDVSVELHINNKFVEKMQFVGIDTAKYFSRRSVSNFRSLSRAQIGDRVKIEAKAPGFETAWAETIIPMPLTIEKVDTATFLTMVQADNNFGVWTGAYSGYEYGGGYYTQIPELSFESFYRTMRLHIDIRKPKSDLPQYFLLKVLKLEHSDKPEFEYSHVELYVGKEDDPIFAKDPKNTFLEKLFNIKENVNNSSAFTDNLFRNNGYTLNVTTMGYYTLDLKYEKLEEESNAVKYISHEVKNPPLEVRVYALSHDFYSYINSNVDSGYDEEFSYISEPKVTFTNVNNGIGFLGSMSHTSKQIEIQPFPGGDNKVPR